MKWNLQRTDFRGYGTAFLSVALTLLIKMALAPVLDPQEWPYLFTIFPVLLAAWVGGWGPGLATTFITALLVYVLFQDFGAAAVPGQPSAAMRAGLFIVQSVILTWIVVMLRTARHHSARSDERFDLLAAGTRDAAIIMLDRIGRIVEWNSGAHRAYGFSASDVMGKSHEELYVEIDRRVGRPSRDLEAAQSGPTLAEAWQTRKDGTRFWAELMITPLHSLKGEPRGFSYLARDMTSRKRIEARLTAEHAITRILAKATSLQDAAEPVLNAVRGSVNATAAILWTREADEPELRFAAADFDGEAPPVGEFVNASRSMMFVKSMELPGRVWEHQEAIFISDVTRDPGFQRTQAAASGGIQSAVAFPIMAGTTLSGVIEVFLTWPLQPDDALLDMMHAIGLEIGQFVQRGSAERRVEELNRNLEHRERQYRASFELAAVGKAFLQPETARFVRVNHKLCEMLGMEAEQLMGLTLHDVVHEEDRMAGAAVFQRIAGGALDDFRAEIRLKRPNGQIIWTNISATLVRTSGGLLEHVIAILQDVTPRILAEQELAQYRNRLEELVFERTAELQETNVRLRLSERMASLGTLSAGLGHDMGNLLLPVKLRLETMALKGIPENLREDISAISTCADYLQRLSNGLRLLSIDPDGAMVAPRRTELKEWWVDVESFFRNALPRGVELERHFQPELPPVAVAKHRLTQAVFNLVQNAGDAIKPGEPGRVRVWADSPEGAVVRVGVTDNGVGMTPEVKARCLEPFFTSKIRGISTGLGLSLVHSVVQQADGTLTIDSEPGKGTTFVLAFKAVPAVTGAPAAPSEKKIPLRALVTVEQERIRRLTQSILRGQQIQVLENGSSDDNGAKIWICDPPRYDPAVAERFLSQRQDRRVVILGNLPEGRRHPGVIELSGPVKHSSIRQAIRGMAVELRGAAGRHHES